MLSLIKKIILFLVPISLIFLFPTVVLILSREYYSVSEAIKIQRDMPATIYNMSYISLFTEYKKELVANRHPEIISVGASRSIEFRSEFFAQPDTFTNAGVPGMRSVDEGTFIKEILQNKSIKVIILSLEPERFRVIDPPYDGPQMTNNVFEWYRSGWRDKYVDYFSGKFSLGQLFKQYQQTSNIGLAALITHDGFRADGSYAYGKTVNDPNHDAVNQVGIDASVEEIQRDRAMFFGNAISADSIASLNSLLAIFKERGVYVVGYLPPFPSKMYKAMVSTDDAYKNTVTGLPVALGEVFSKYDFSFFNFSDSGTLGGSDNEFIDPGHGSDKMYLRMSMYMAEHDKTLANVFSGERMKEILQNTKGDFLSP